MGPRYLRDMGKDSPRWVDGGALNWTPERPLAFAPEASAEPRLYARPQVRTPRAGAKRRARAFLLPWRLTIGLAQGLFIYALVHTRALGLLPGADPYVFDALALAGLFAPLLLLEGIGTIPGPRLAAWTVLAAAVLAGLGWYHRWRIFGSAQSHAGVSLIVLAAIALFIGQAFLQARTRAGGWRIPYPDLFDAAWTLTARLSVWALAAGAGTALLNSPVTLRPHLPGGDLVAMPLIGLMGAVAFQLTAALPGLTGAWKKTIVAVATMALPVTCGAALFLVSAALGHGPAPLVALCVAMAVLLVAINASHRGPVAARRGLWRDGGEVFGAFLLLILAGLSVWALGLRVEAFGWTAMRIFAGVAVAFFLAYGAGYSGAALIGLGGGGPMRRLETVNVFLGVVLMAACLALASPAADPMRLAVWAQQDRLEDGRVTVERFDFADLKRNGARFGRDALAALAHSPFADIARAATLTQQASAAPEDLNPTEIGANIEVHTPGARLPAALLARDWKGVAVVPPCLTLPAQACDAYFLDLDGDGVNEILLVSGGEARWWGAVMKADIVGRWSPVGRIAAPACGKSLGALRTGRFAMADPLPGWRDLVVAGQRLSVVAAGGGACPK